MTTPTDPQTPVARALQYNRDLETEQAQCERWRQRCHDWQDRTDKAERELADHKAKMVDLLADAYAKGRGHRDEDDRTSEHD